MRRSPTIFEVDDGGGTYEAVAGKQDGFELLTREGSLKGFRVPAMGAEQVDRVQRALSLAWWMRGASVSCERSYPWRSDESRASVVYKTCFASCAALMMWSRYAWMPSVILSS